MEQIIEIFIDVIIWFTLVGIAYELSEIKKKL